MKQLHEFEEWFAKIQSGENKSDEMKFVWELMKTPYVEYHYRLLKDENVNESFKVSLGSRFNEHKEAGEIFLLSKLENNLDVKFHGEIIFQLGRFKGIHKAKTLQHVRRFTKSADNSVRNNAIIVLGWLGETEDTEILSERLITDINSACRAGAASSFMQMWFRLKSDEVKIKAFKSYQQSLKIENDHFVTGCIVDAIQTIGQKKFGLSQKNLSFLEIDKIGASKIKAERFLDKLFKN